MASDKHYVSCVPQKGIDGRYYVNPKDTRGEVDVYHLSYELENGNAREVRQIGTAKSPEEVPPGKLVCFGREPTVWEYVPLED